VEVGGVLLGAMSEDGTLAITSCVPVACSHAQGSSYMLSHEEFKRMSATVEEFAPGRGRRVEAVGFFRSHTREGLGLSMDDVRIFDTLFPAEYAVALLVKPTISRVSQGAFFIREDGNVQRESSYMEFPFRRKELGGEAAGEPWYEEAEPEIEMSGDEVAPAPTAAAPAWATENGLSGQPGVHGGILGLGGAGKPQGQRGERAPAEKDKPLAVDGNSKGAQGKRTGRGRRWALLPLSFLFLLLGMFLGLQSAMTFAPRFLANAYTIGLRAAATDSVSRRVQVYWNTSALAVSLAQDGTLYIDDGGVQKTVPLTRDQLLTGRAIYPASSDRLRFRLDIRVRANASYSEAVEYNRN
jgi:hypothetical protein